jgi:hypothetical protein
MDSSTDETKAVFDNGNQLLPFTVAGLSFAKKVKRGWDIVRIISEELGSYKVTSFLEFFHRDKKDNSPCVEHLEYYEKKEALNLHFNLMLAGLFGILKDAYQTFL